MIGVLSAAAAWATLLGGDRRLDHGAASIVSQIAKYIPGGVWQASGQLGLARTVGVQLQRGAVAFTVQALMQAVAACTFGAVVAVTWTDGAGWLRVLLALASVFSLALVDRRWMVWILHKIPRTRDASSDLVPPQRAILLTYLAGARHDRHARCRLPDRARQLRCGRRPVAGRLRLRDRVARGLSAGPAPVGARGPGGGARRHPARHVPVVGAGRGERVPARRADRHRRSAGADRLAPGAPVASCARPRRGGQPRRGRLS